MRVQMLFPGTRIIPLLMYPMRQFFTLRRAAPKAISPISGGALSVLTLMALAAIRDVYGSTPLELLGAAGLLTVCAYLWFRGRVPHAIRYPLVLAGLFVCFLALPDGAYAQFGQGMESYFNSSFPGANTTTKTVFEGFRALYLIYLLVSLIGVVNHIRSQEDWTTPARLPVIVIVCVTIMDSLTNYITGGAGGGVGG